MLDCVVWMKDYGWWVTYDGLWMVDLVDWRGC